MAKEMVFENSRISNFKGLVTSTLTLNRVMLHTVVHHSSTSTYTPNFIEIEETFWTDVRTDKFTEGHLRPALLGGLCRRVDLKISRLSFASTTHSYSSYSSSSLSTSQGSEHHQSWWHFSHKYITNMHVQSSVRRTPYAQDMGFPKTQSLATLK